MKNAEFVHDAVLELLDNGCIKEVYRPSFVVIPLTVSVNISGKKRLVLDLRHVNQFIEKQKIKFEGIKEAMYYAKKGKLMINFDSKSGYHHVDIHPVFQK